MIRRALVVLTLAGIFALLGASTVRCCREDICVYPGPDVEERR